MWLVGQFNASGHAQPAFIEELESSLYKTVYIKVLNLYMKRQEKLYSKICPQTKLIWKHKFITGHPVENFGIYI